LPKSGIFFTILAPHSHSHEPTGAKFCTAKQTDVPSALDEMHVVNLPGLT